MRLRPAEPGEAPALHALAQRAYVHYVPRMGTRPGPMDDDYAARVAAGQVVVAEDDDGLVGFVVLVVHADHLQVANVAVEPTRQGSGLGRALLAHAEEQARAAGLPELRLHTNETMTENIARYAHLGWQETGRVTQGRYHRVLFAKRLA